MCIICNTDDQLNLASNFLDDFSHASKLMKSAADRLKGCAAFARTAEKRKAYDASHKKMVRLIREWNRIEHERELPVEDRS